MSSLLWTAMVAGAVRAAVAVFSYTADRQLRCSFETRNKVLTDAAEVAANYSIYLYEHYTDNII